MGLFNRIPRAEKKESKPPKGHGPYRNGLGQPVKKYHTEYVGRKEPVNRHFGTPIYGSKRSAIIRKTIR